MKKMYILALISALICGFLLYSFLTGLKTESQTIDIERTEVLVAAEDIEPYADLTPAMFKTTMVPMEGLHPQAVTSFEQITGKKSSCSFLAGELILLSKFGEDVEGYASYQIPEGMRVMTISVGSVSGLDQHLTPGDLVDVMFTAISSSSDQDTEDSKSSTNTDEDEEAVETEEGEEVEAKTYLYEGVEVTQSVTAVLLESAEVFTTGSALDEDGMAYSTVSLILTPQDCLKLYASENYGSFSLVLRGHNDYTPGETSPIQAEDILPQPEEEAPDNTEGEE
ncbi:MAG: Flp pilus assembly protein CpaB [Lachnospiraceae bacterium]|nr:Flp pilus assembly protein CpaB [Lachnospiraceae bacterium]